MEERLGNWVRNKITHSPSLSTPRDERLAPLTKMFSYSENWPKLLHITVSILTKLVTLLRNVATVSTTSNICPVVC